MNKRKTGTPFLFKGRPKKQKPRIKESPNLMKETKERPPTRRNPNDILASDKTRNTPLSKAGKRTPSGKFKTTSSLGLQTPKEKTALNCEQHEYLQFSLRITEEIIRSDMYKNDEMIQVLKHHYMAHKSRLNQDKLLKTIAELCSELNIPMDDNMMLFLDDRGGYSRVGAEALADRCTPPASPISYDSCSDNNRRSPPSSVPDGKYISQGDNVDSYLQLNKVDHKSQHGDERAVQMAEPYADVGFANVGNESPNSLGLQLVESDDRTSKQQPDLFSEETPVPVIAMKDADGFDCASDATDFAEHKHRKENGYVLEVLRSPTVLEDLSKAFEFGEETLKAPGEESLMNVNLDMKLRDVHEIKEFRVLHDATARFIRDSDKDSYASVQLQAIAANGMETNDKPVFVMNFEKPDRKMEKNLVIAHYSTSVEPELVETKEFSTQVMLDSSSNVNYEDSVPNVNVQHGSGGHYLNDATTQKSVSMSEDTESVRVNPPRRKPAHAQGQNADMRRNCKQCNCRDMERDRDREVREMDRVINDPMCMTSTEAQYVLLDCPVLIPREHTNSMDFLNSIANRGGNMEKSYHTLNIRMPTTSYLPKTSTTVMGAGPSGLLGGPPYRMERSDLHNSDYYDLTPQKDLFQNKSQTPLGTHPNPSTLFGCCSSCMATNMGANKLMTDKYDKVVRTDKADRTDRLDRYKKVNENLSYFYPTIATQVSSMDLLNNEVNLLHKNQQQQQQQHVVQYNYANQRSTQQHPFDTARNRDDYPQRIEYTSNSDEVPSTTDDTPNNPSVYKPALPMPKGSSLVEKRERKEAKINLDNYRLDSMVQHHAGHKRPYGEDLSANRELLRSKGRSLSQQRALSPAKSPVLTGRAISDIQSDSRQSEEEVSLERTLGPYASNSNDSMEKRIMSLRHDIEKYSKDDLTSKRNAGDSSGKRGDIFEILRQNSLVGTGGGGLLPSEVPLPRQRKMSVLRKQTKEKA